MVKKQFFSVAATAAWIGDNCLLTNNFVSVVTGCTDGIGLAYAEYIAAQGINIVLVSRSQARLETTAKSLGAYKIKFSGFQIIISTISLCRRPIQNTNKNNCC